MTERNSGFAPGSAAAVVAVTSQSVEGGSPDGFVFYD